MPRGKHFLLLFTRSPVDISPLKSIFSVIWKKGGKYCSSQGTDGLLSAVSLCVRMADLFPLSPHLTGSGCLETCVRGNLRAWPVSVGKCPVTNSFNTYFSIHEGLIQFYKHLAYFLSPLTQSLSITCMTFGHHCDLLISETGLIENFVLSLDRNQKLFPHKTPQIFMA